MRQAIFASAQVFEDFTASGCAPDGVATFACVGVLLHNLVIMMLIGSALATLLMLLIGGVRFVISGGDPKRVQQARGTLTYAIVGIVVVFLSFIILRLVSDATGNTDILNGLSVPPSTPTRTP